jgi:membrane-bound serine protease (ClpP class)
MMPILGLPVFWLLPMPVAAPGYAVIVALSLWLYSYILRSMRRPVETGMEEILHSTGKVIETGHRLLKVQVHSEIWNARSSDQLHKGDAVKVAGMNGLTLRVQRLDDNLNTSSKLENGL